MGADWAQANIGMKAPYRLTVWDYFSITTGSSEQDVWNFAWILAAFAIGFKLITLFSMMYVKHVNR
jgi:hypothetical protein